MATKAGRAEEEEEVEGVVLSFPLHQRARSARLLASPEGERSRRGARPPPSPSSGLAPGCRAARRAASWGRTGWAEQAWR